MKIKRKLLIWGVVVMGMVSVFLGWKVFQEGEVVVVTDKTQYLRGADLRIKIENYLAGNVCFSSCYPYLLERKNGELWEYYNYVSCGEQDLVQKCMGLKEIKAFEIPLDNYYKQGLHRIAIPACNPCQGGEEFKESKRFYSNPFTIQ